MAYKGATSLMESSFATIAALIVIDAPQQLRWHLAGAIRNGATREEVKAVRAIAIEISKAAGISCKHEIPDLN
jgi:alkylhydroperoxidase/carboxymuconolactone decarboxylase family protein YurZ